MTLRRLTLRIKLEQFVGHVRHGFADARFGFSPGGRSQMIERRLYAFRRTILLHQIKAREWHIKPRAFGIFQQHQFNGAVILLNFLEPLILSNPMFHVDDVIAYL